MFGVVLFYVLLGLTVIVYTASLIKKIVTKIKDKKARKED